MATNDQIHYIIESTGPIRMVWGPYSLEKARREAGKRHVVVTGNLKSGLSIPEHDVQVLQNTGSIVPIDANVKLVN